MYRAVIWNKDGEILDIGDEKLVDRWENEQTLYLWLDAYDNKLEEEKDFLKKTFAIHDYAISDAQRTRHPPKIEIFTSTEIMLLKEVREATPNDLSNTIQLALITGDRFIVTRRSGPSPVVNSLWSQINTNRTTRLNSPRTVALKFAQQVADNYTLQLLTTEERLDDIEEKMYDSPNDTLLSSLIGYQTQLRKAHRNLLYHKQLFTRSNLKQFDRQNEIDEILWNNVYEHTERSYSLALLYYELSSDLIEGHISLSSHRLNQIMKILTVITVIFVPLSFLAGIYGMNFEYMPELKNRSAYFILLGVMFSLASILLIIFRRNKWL